MFNYMYILQTLHSYNKVYIDSTPKHTCMPPGRFKDGVAEHGEI